LHRGRQPAAALALKWSAGRDSSPAPKWRPLAGRAGQSAGSIDGWAGRAAPGRAAQVSGPAHWRGAALTTTPARAHN